MERLWGEAPRVQQHIQISRSVITPTTLSPLSASTGTVPQSHSHMTWQAALSGSFVRHDITSLVISSETLMVPSFRVTVVTTRFVRPPRRAARRNRSREGAHAGAL